MSLCCFYEKNEDVHSSYSKMGYVMIDEMVAVFVAANLDYIESFNWFLKLWQFCVVISIRQR